MFIAIYAAKFKEVIQNSTKLYLYIGLNTTLDLKFVFKISLVAFNFVEDLTC